MTEPVMRRGNDQEPVISVNRETGVRDLIPGSSPLKPETIVNIVNDGLTDATAEKRRGFRMLKKNFRPENDTKMECLGVHRTADNVRRPETTQRRSLLDQLAESSDQDDSNDKTDEAMVAIFVDDFTKLKQNEIRDYDGADTSSSESRRSSSDSGSVGDSAGRST